MTKQIWEIKDNSITWNVKSTYVSKIFHTAPDSISLTPDEEISFEIFYTSNTADKKISLPDGEGQLSLRRQRISGLCDNSLVLKTDCRELDLMFRFAKLRAGESIFETLTGKYHSPGGHRYYAAMYLYGASLFCLYLGNPDVTKELYGAINM